MMPPVAVESQRVCSSDVARIPPSPSDRVSSPVSKYSWNVLDEWSLAVIDREHSNERESLTRLPTWLMLMTATSQGDLGI